MTLLGAVLAFWLGPWGVAPPAHADELDAILDPIINSLSSVDPTLGADASGWLANVDSALAAASAFDPSSAASSLGALSTDVSSASGADPFSTFVQGLEQDWMNSPLGQQVDSSVNAWFNQVDPAADPANTGAFGECGLICNGNNGVGGGSLADATGQGGGLLFGNGGNGATDSAGVGGAGGDAGAWGTGGNGGDGADGFT